MYQSAGIKTDMASIFKYLNIPFVDSAVSGAWRKMMLKSNAATLAVAANAPVDNIVPDVTGLGLKDAVYLLENKGLKLSMNGRGKVINQLPAAGTNYTKGQKIILWLN